MKHCFTLFLLLLLAGRAFGQQDQSSELAALLASAQQAQAANHYVEAAADYQQAVKLRPDIPELRANLGLMQHEAGEYSDAIRNFQEVLRQKPSLYVPNLFLGIDYVRTGRAKEAVPLLLKAEKMNVKDPLPALTLGRAYSSLGDDASATRALHHAIEIDPKQSSAWFFLGIAYLRQVETDSRAMTGEDAGSAYAKALYAEALTKQSRYKEAADLYKDILAAKDQPPCMEPEAGFVALLQGDAQAAAVDFKIAHPECSLAILGEARLHLDAGANDDALQLLQDIWQRDHGFFAANASVVFDRISPDHAKSFLDFLAQQQASSKLQQDFFAVLSQAIQGESPSGEEETAAAVSTSTAEKNYLAGHYGRCAAQLRGSLHSSNPDALHLLAACSFFTGDYALTSDAGRALLALPSHPAAAALYWSIKANEKLALASLASFEQLEPNSERSHLLLGDIYRQRARYDDAQKEYSKALAIAPNDPAALMGLASAYLGDAKMDDTIATARKALAISPDDPEINIVMGEALIAQHKFPDAEPFLQKGLNAKPQMLPHVHALLGQTYAAEGKVQDAIREFKLGADSDEDGSIHYQLARLYARIGDKVDADAAIAQMKVLQQQYREGAAIAVQDSHPSSLDDTQ